MKPPLLAALVCLTAGLASAQDPQSKSPLLSELAPGTAVTLSRTLSDEIARDDAGFALTTFINGVKVDLENLRGALAATILPGPGLWAAVGAIPKAQRGACAAGPSGTVMSLTAVRLLEAGGRDPELVLDLAGPGCVEAIHLRLIRKASRVDDLRAVTVEDLEETFGVDASGTARLKLD